MPGVWRGRVPGEEEEETKLVTVAQRGDRLAFDRLTRIYARSLRGYLVRRVGMDAVDDVLAETWLAAWLALPGYSRRSRFKTWLFGIGYYKSVDYLRGRLRNAPDLSLDATDRELPDTRDAIAASEQTQEIRALLSQLPPEQREVLELYYYADLTLGEVARALKRNLNTVKAQFYRAHASAAQILDSVETLSASRPGSVRYPDVPKVRTPER